MIDALFVTAIAIASVFIYATIACTIFRAHIPAIYERCTGPNHIKAYGSGRMGPSNHPDRAIRRYRPTCRQQDEVQWFAFFCFFWPLVLVFALGMVCSKCPASWGAAIVSRMEKGRSPLMRMSADEITLLEIECGLRDAD